MRLVRLEITRALRRRMVWVLVAVAVVGIGLMGVIAFLDSADLDAASLRAEGTRHPAILVDWWNGADGDSPLLIAAIFLLMGGLIGGAGVVGGEWRAGSVATLLTWEPRRVRLLSARLAAIVTCSFVIAVALQLLLLLALVPSVLLHGSTAGADAELAVSVAAAIVRIAAMTAFAALLGGCLASVSGNTAGAIVGGWVWLSLVEGILRARKPWVSVWLVGDNLVRVVNWADFDGAPAHRSPAVALFQLGVYSAVVAGLALQAFRRIDAVTS